MDVFDTVSTDERKILNLQAAGFSGMPVLGHYCYRKAAGSLQREVHQEHFEITYLTKGVQIYETEGQRTVLRGGDLYITRPGESHSTAGQPEEKGEAYWIFLKSVPTGAGLFRFTEVATANLMQALTRCECKCRASAQLQTHLDAIVDLFEGRSDPWKEMALAARVELLALELGDCFTKDRKSEPGGAIGRVLETLGPDGGWEVGIEDLAKLAGLSEARFKVKFKAEVGIPPGEYLMRRRIEKAKYWLRRSPWRIAEIAKRLDYPTSQYFATVFKRYTGKTPQDWRDERKAESGKSPS